MLNGVYVSLQLDTASDISVISVDTWKKLGKPPTRTPSVKAKAASGNLLKLVSDSMVRLLLTVLAKSVRFS